MERLVFETQGKAFRKGCLSVTICIAHGFVNGCMMMTLLMKCL
jgi:hypothetical protein